MKHALAILLFAAGPAAAQGSHFASDGVRFTGFYGVGFSSPVNPLAAKADIGWGLMGGVGLTNNWIGVTVDAMYTDFGLNRAALQQSGSPKGNQKYWSLTLDPVFHINEKGPVDLYITGGGGIYNQITDYKTPGFGGPFYGNGGYSSSYSIYKPGVNGGAGFAFGPGTHSHLKIFAEARFHHMFIYGSGASFVLTTFGARF